MQLARLARTVSPANLRRLFRLLRDLRWFRQLSCAHCYATDVTGRTTPLALVRRSIAEFDRLGCISVMLVGGEPTLHRDLTTIVREIRARRMLPFLFTNGQALHPGLLDELRAAGLFGVLFSVLGLGDTHDEFVGCAGAYERLLVTLDGAVARDFYVAINTTPTHAMIASGEFEQLERLARDRSVRLKFNYPALLGRYADRTDQLLDDEERAWLAAKLEAGAISNDKQTSWLDETCPAGRYALYVTDDGEVTPCAYIPISFGNVGEESLEAIHARMQRSPLFGREHRVCLVGEDRAFIERFIRPTAGGATLPVRWTDHPARAELVADARERAS